MKRTDIVELLVDKDEYKEKGVQKGMRGRITDYGVPQENKKRKVFLSLEKLIIVLLLRRLIFPKMI